MDNKKTFLANLDSKNSLLLGLIGAIVILGVLALIIRGASRLYAASYAHSADMARDNPELPAVTNADHIRGDNSALVTIVEYSDFECPFCHRFDPIVQKIMSDYNGKVRWVFRDFPLTSIHAHAERLAEGSECVAAQGGNTAFWGYADRVFATTDFSDQSLSAIVTSLNLNSGSFFSCLNSGKYRQKIQNMKNAGAAAGVSGTPGSFIIGHDGSTQFISGAVPYETLKAAVDAALTH